MGASPAASPDERIVYGARCTWWDSVDKIGTKPSNRSARRAPADAPVLGLPCCPHCGGVLFEVDNEAAWWAGVDEHVKTEPGYRELIEWSRGRCFTDFGALRVAYQAAT